MKNWYEELYNKAQDAIARPVHVANPNPLYNKTVITENGSHDVSNFAVANIDVEDGGGTVEYEYRTITIQNDTTQLIGVPSVSVEDGWVIERTTNIKAGSSAEVRLPIPTNPAHTSIQFQTLTLRTPSYFINKPIAFSQGNLTYRGYINRNSSSIILIFEIASNSPKNFSVRFYEAGANVE